MTRLLERCIKESKAVDTESLCIVAEEKVWGIRLDIRILNHEGNVADCASIAGLAALAHFRRPDVSLDGNKVTVSFHKFFSNTISISGLLKKAGSEF